MFYIIYYIISFYLTYFCFDSRVNMKKILQLKELLNKQLSIGGPHLLVFIYFGTASSVIIFTHVVKRVFVNTLLRQPHFQLRFSLRSVLNYKNWIRSILRFKFKGKLFPYRLYCRPYLRMSYLRLRFVALCRTKPHEIPGRFSISIDISISKRSVRRISSEDMIYGDTVYDITDTGIIAP